MRVVPFYDRSGLIKVVVDTLKHPSLRRPLLSPWCTSSFAASALGLIVTMPLPLAVLAAFLGMRYAGISANIMSLAGIAIAIGVLVDAAIVVTENAFRFLEQRRVDPRDRQAVDATVRDAAPRSDDLFLHGDYPLAFLPVLLSPARRASCSILAFTKTCAVLGATLLAVTPDRCRCLFASVGRTDAWRRR